MQSSRNVMPDPDDAFQDGNLARDLHQVARTRPDRDRTRANQDRSRPDKDRETEPGGLNSVSKPLWILLGCSVLFLIGVQLYLGTLDRPALVGMRSVAEAPILSTESPPLPTSPEMLQLQWGDVPGAVTYQLRIRAADRSPIVDPVVVWGTSWQPNPEVVPGLVPGVYEWQVEALDTSGTILARSEFRTLEIDR